MLRCVQGDPLGPTPQETITSEPPLLPGLKPSPPSIRLLDPTFEGTLFGDRHLALDLKQLTRREVGVERPYQLQAFQEHLHSTILDLLISGFQQSPLQLWVETTAVLLDLILIELSGLSQPTIRVAVEASPVEKRIDVDGLASKLDTVLLETSLQLLVLLLGSGHILQAGGQGYRCRERPTSPLKGLIETDVAVQLKMAPKKRWFFSQNQCYKESNQRNV